MWGMWDRTSDRKAASRLVHVGSWPSVLGSLFYGKQLWRQTSGWSYSSLQCRTIDSVLIENDRLFDVMPAALGTPRLFLINLLLRTPSHSLPPPTTSHVDSVHTARQCTHTHTSPAASANCCVIWSSTSNQLQQTDHRIRFPKNSSITTQVSSMAHVPPFHQLLWKSIE